MKTISSALRDILAGNNYFIVDCYTFLLANGQVLRYATADADVTDAATGHVFASSGPFFERGQVKFRIGVEVDELDITVKDAASTPMWSGGPAWMPGLIAGVLDGAEVQLDRAFMNNFGDTSAGLVTLFYGRVTEVDPGRTVATIKVNTHLELLNLQWPWRLFQPGCARTLFDAACTLTKSAFAVSCAVTSGSSLQFLHTNYAQPSASADAGTLTFTSGALSGQSYAIKKQVSGVISMLTPLPQLPAIGDTLNVYPGCDKTMATCDTKFANLAHFQGEPFVPAPETAA